MASTCAAASTCSESGPPSLYLNNEKWKLSKKEGSSSSSRNRSSTSICPLMKKNSSTQRCAFARKCARLVKEQRARFYIMRRCVIMLICWHEYNDS